MTNERLLAAGLEQLSGFVSKLQSDTNRVLGRFESELVGLKKDALRNADSLTRILRSVEVANSFRATDQRQYQSSVAEMKERIAKLEGVIEGIGLGRQAENLARGGSVSGPARKKNSESGALFEPLLREDNKVPELLKQPSQELTSAFGDWPQTRPANRKSITEEDNSAHITDKKGNSSFDENDPPAGEDRVDLRSHENSHLLWIEARRPKSAYLAAILTVLLLASILTAAVALNLDVKEQTSAGRVVSIPLRTLSTTDPPSSGFNDTVFAVEVTSDALAISRHSSEDWENKRTYNNVVQMANFGNSAAQTVLGLWAIDDSGAAPVDLKAAVRYLTLAAKQGQAVAQYRLGSLYEHAEGVPQDLSQATRWYEMAAKQGNRRAMHNLAVFKAAGALDKTNMQEAAYWFEKAANLGLPDSQFVLAMLLEQGDGVPKNLLQAYKWDLIASQSDFQQARKHMVILRRQMNKVDLDAARKLAAAFRPEPLNEAANNPPQAGNL